MNWRESVSLIQELGQDPSSHIAAAVAGWEFPWSVEAFILADLMDAYAKVNSDGKAPVYPRPNRAVKPAPKHSQDEIRAALRARGHLKD